MSTIALVIPTVGRDTLRALLDSLTAAGARCDELFVVDDRRADVPLDVHVDAAIAQRVAVLRSHGRGPAAARNTGWRAAHSNWICFLDDDVLVTRGWWDALRKDLDEACDVGGSQGRVEVPLPGDRAPTDWERNVAGLAQSWWITADMAYRRCALEAAGGFDERFPRAYREDSDLALRVQRLGYRLVKGMRHVLHPVRAADRWISVRLQRGNADDVLMRALHGPQWRSICGAGSGRMRQHLAIVAASALTLGSFLLWAALVSRFAYERIAPGPRTPDEMLTMLLTSALIPYAALYHRVRAEIELPRLLDDAA